jgi:hypothetical protein
MIENRNALARMELSSSETCTRVIVPGRGDVPGNAALGDLHIYASGDRVWRLWVALCSKTSPTPTAQTLTTWPACAGRRSSAQADHTRLCPLGHDPSRHVRLRAADEHRRPFCLCLRPS